MYELIRAGERSYYIDCPAKIGLYDTGDGVCLIDSGNDKDAGRKVRQLLERCLSCQAGIVRCCLKLNSNAKPTKCRRISFI